MDLLGVSTKVDPAIQNAKGMGLDLIVVRALEISADR